MSTPRIKPLPEIPSEVEAARTADLDAVVGTRGLCTNFKRFVTDQAYRDRWSPKEPRPNSKADQERYLADARSACDGCQAIVECLEIHLRWESGRGRAPHGIGGGATPGERRELIELRAQRHNEQLAGVA